MFNLLLFLASQASLLETGDTGYNFKCWKRIGAEEYFHAMAEFYSSISKLLCKLHSRREHVDFVDHATVTVTESRERRQDMTSVCYG